MKHTYKHIHTSLLQKYIMHIVTSILYYSGTLYLTNFFFSIYVTT